MVWPATIPTGATIRPTQLIVWNGAALRAYCSGVPGAAAFAHELAHAAPVPPTVKGTSAAPPLLKATGSANHCAAAARTRDVSRAALPGPVRIRARPPAVTSARKRLEVSPVTRNPIAGSPAACSVTRRLGAVGAAV